MQAEHGEVTFTTDHNDQNNDENTDLLYQMC